MGSLYHAYEAYERRVMRGEFSNHRLARATNKSTSREPILARFGDLLIRTGLKLKRRYATGMPMAWSPMTGSKSLKTP
jgi:hypothetical protein